MSSPPPVQVEVEVGDDSMEEDIAHMLPPDRIRLQKQRALEARAVRFALPARANALVESWRTKLQEGVLTAAHFQDHWRVVVPRIYSPQPNRTCLDWNFDEDLALRILIQPLEHFIWGTKEGEPQKTTRRSTLCGRVFKQGEPAYSCRECGMDNTCVLCVECFKVSAHRNHKYKMGQSGGGGCCDCGDTEAWKRDPFCELHGVPEEQGDVSGITEDVVERMKIVACVVLCYCFRLLTLDHEPGLPSDLRLKDAERDPLQILDQPDCYCTVLYNDEIHTFEQVIATLSRVLKCGQRDSVELVTLIDREGRALVRCNSFQVCDTLKTEVETFTTNHGGTALRVLVMHAHLIAHQLFAMKLLAWLQSFVSVSPALRAATSRVALGETPLGGAWGPGGPGGAGVAAGVMHNDVNMWKAARVAWHRLLIATTIMDYDTKRSLAILFTKNYASILKDFIRDDHDHSFSVSSLSVQLYTTPTLAHHLISKYDALFVVMNTLVSECVRRCNKGRLEFQRGHSSGTFKRAQFILYDVKYLLSSVPTNWDDDLRKGFLHGLSLLFNLLAMMQGMDSVVRQVGQHMEYEPEWETAFNLHVKVARSITLALEWCASDKTVLVKAFRMLLRKYKETESFPTTIIQELAWRSAAVIPYDVSKEPVSVHRPLSRFMSGLYLLLHEHDLSYHDRNFDLIDLAKPTPEELIEPVLRTTAMVAQVQAGMWRRNGFALLNQLYFYHNVKCRGEMLDRDIAMLQIGASLIESNEFVIHVLNKFHLMEWASADFESKPVEDDVMRHTISMVEEFLSLLITVIGSRYMPGVGEVTHNDRTKKEIIQMLCVKDMPHSELNRSLPEDQLNETGLEAVIHEVADFSKPTGGNNRGMYKLKPDLYDQYDIFFYHYTREDLSRSEEAQRSRRKAAGLPECCPPPPLPKLTPPFKLLAQLLQCDMALHVLKTVFERALDLRSRCFSESQVHKALHLVGYALRDEESGHYEFLAFAESAARAGLLPLLQRLAAFPRVDAHRPLALWTLARLRSLLGESNEIGDGEHMDVDIEKPETDDKAEKQRRAELAAARRAKLMAQMQAAQHTFICNNATLFEAPSRERRASPAPAPAPALALGVWGGAAADAPRVCIMCQEEGRVEAVPMVVVAFVQTSAVLSRQRQRQAPWTRAWLPPGLGAAPHVSSCGHALHDHCCRKYIDNVVDKENRRPYRLRQPAAFDVEKKEFICPLCERLCNTVLPLLPAPAIPPNAPPLLSEKVFSESIDTILKHQVCLETVHHCTESCEEMHCIATSKCEETPWAMDLSEPEGIDEPPVYIMTHSRELLDPEFLVHFDTEVPEYNVRTKEIIEEFISVNPGCDRRRGDDGRRRGGGPVGRVPLRRVQRARERGRAARRAPALARRAACAPPRRAARARAPRRRAARRAPLAAPARAPRARGPAHARALLAARPRALLHARHARARRARRLLERQRRRPARPPRAPPRAARLPRPDRQGAARGAPRRGRRLAAARSRRRRRRRRPRRAAAAAARGAGRLPGRDGCAGALGARAARVPRLPAKLLPLLPLLERHEPAGRADRRERRHLGGDVRLPRLAELVRRSAGRRARETKSGRVGEDAGDDGGGGRRDDDSVGRAAGADTAAGGLLGADKRGVGVLVPELGARRLQVPDDVPGVRADRVLAELLLPGRDEGARARRDGRDGRGRGRGRRGGGRGDGARRGVRRRRGAVPARARLRAAAAGGAVARRARGGALPRLVRRDRPGSSSREPSGALSRAIREAAHDLAQPRHLRESGTHHRLQLPAQQHLAEYVIDITNDLENMAPKAYYGRMCVEDHTTRFCQIV